MNIKTLTLYILASLGISGCSMQLHAPSSPNIPMLDTNYVFSSELSFTTNGIDLKSTGSILKHIVVSGTFNSNSPTYYYEGATGIQWQFDWCYLSLLGGYGKGISEFHEGDGGSSYDMAGEGKYNKLFIQPVVAFGDLHNKFGIVYKVAKMNYAITDLNLYARDIIFNKYYTSYSYEPSIFYRHRYHDDIMLTFYAGACIFNTSIPINLSKFQDATPFAGIGLGFSLK